MGGILIFYLIEHYLLSQKIEEANPETIHKIEEKIHNLEEKLHLTTSPNREKKTETEKEEKAKAAKRIKYFPLY